ncbi:MAG: hypothetical protein A2051_00905 [Desulfovibrionales bacterium GWA2_65_9]|nr:MAG: hypothetical protein A2051_00905 [Desulfovibrionales bacterium GWA2_65_9]
MEGLSLLLLFLILWLVDRFLGAAVRSLHGARTMAAAVEHADVNAEPRQASDGQMGAGQRVPDE